MALTESTKSQSNKLHTSPDDPIVTVQDGLDAAKGVLISLCIAGPFWALAIWWWLR